MARSEARIKTAIWNDPDFVALDPMTQWVYVVALSQPTVSFCGVTPYTPRKWSNLAGGVTVAVVRKAIKTLSNHDYVIVDEDTEELWIRTFIKHDGVLAKPNIVIAMTKDFAAIQSPTIAVRFLDALGERFLGRFDPVLRKRFGEPFVKSYAKRYPQPFPEGLPEPLVEPFPEPIGQPSRAYSSTSSSTSILRLQPLPQQGTVPPSPADSEQSLGTSKAETEDAQNDTKEPQHPLVESWLTDVMAMPPGERRPRVILETHQVVEHVRQWLDDRAIADRIAYCATLDQRPGSAKYLLETCTRWAAERGITIPSMRKASG